MLAKIVNETPTWVFFLFFALVGLGYLQSRPRRTSRAGLWFLPAGMTVFSIYGTVSTFGFSAQTFFAWTAGLGVMVLRGLVQSPSRQASFEPASRRFVIEGNWMPMAVTMAIFCTKYAVGVVLARQLPVVSDSTFIALVSFAYGVFSSVFVSRAWRVWRCQPNLRFPVLAMPFSRRAL